MATPATENFLEECSPTNSLRIHGHLTFLRSQFQTFFFPSCISREYFRPNCAESSLHPPAKLLFRSLETTDLCVGLITEPFDVSAWLSMMNKRWNVCNYPSATTFVVGPVLCGVSLLSVTAISVDKLPALSWDLRHRYAVTLKRTYLVVITFCVVSIFYTTMWFWNRLIFSWLRNTVTLLCLTASTVSLTKIFSTLRRQQAQAQGHVHQGQQRNTIQLNISGYKN